MSRLADYGIVLMAHLARSGEAVCTSPQLAESTHLPLPTVRKLLKLLSNKGLVESTRGVNGGYRLGKIPDQITVREVVEAIEGPVSLTECSEDGHENCQLEGVCNVAPQWSPVNAVIQSALERVTLTEMLEGQA